MSGFCWVELATTDKEKAAWSYARLFGWEPRPLMLPSHGWPIDYSVLGSGPRVACGMYVLLAGQRKLGLQAHWLPYAFVDDVRATAERAVELGGKVLAAPLQVADLGRLAILRDPLGTLVGAWQPQRMGPDFQTRDQAGFPCWFEHCSTDLRRAAVFYTALFGWNARSTDLGAGEYVLLDHGGAPFAGLSTRVLPDGAAPGWLTFFQVEDCEASCAKLGALRGAVLSPTVEIAGTGRHAIVRDPQGAVFGFFTPPS